MALLTRDAILSASDIKTKEVLVPEWGGTVCVKGLTAAQRDKVESVMYSLRASKNGDMSMSMTGVRALVASLCIVDAEGKQMFTERDVRALGEKSGAALDRVYEAATDLSAIGADDIEELTKNSEAETTADSHSG